MLCRGGYSSYPLFEAAFIVLVYRNIEAPLLTRILRVSAPEAVGR